MERFAIKIDKKLKANLYKICRLCGMDNETEMVSIIAHAAGEEPPVDVDAEPEMSQKINLLIGLSVTKDDRMPQTMCCLCVDKINDFYEFREMCYATNAQTRKLLGLRAIKKPMIDIKPKMEVKEEESIVPTNTAANTAAPTTNNKNANRKRKLDEVVLKEESPVFSKKKLRFSIPEEPPAVKKEEPPAPLITKKKLRFSSVDETPLKKEVALIPIIVAKKLKKEEPLIPIIVAKKLKKEEPPTPVVGNKKSKKSIDQPPKVEPPPPVVGNKKSKKSVDQTPIAEPPAPVVINKKSKKSIDLTKIEDPPTPVVSMKKTRKTIDLVEEAPPPTVVNKKLKKSVDLTPEAPLKKEPSPPLLVVSNKKLRLAATALKEAATKKAKKGSKPVVEPAVKEEIKEEIKEEPAPAPPAPAPPVPAAPPAPKLKHGCNICKERFVSKVKLETHTRLVHLPKIERYVCTACNEVLSKSFDIKNHQLWHKLSKTPYICGCCGESILNTYAFTRHLRDHTFETPPALMVLDRECPQCHTSYATNFLYNTHSCAVKTKRCAGCNRLQRNEAEYVKHSAQCAKVYLNYSKHIMPTVEAQEDAVRIKNENDVEAAAEEMARLTGVSLDMAPVVQLTRLSTGFIMAANQCVVIPGLDDAASTSSSKKSGKKGATKKDFRRVDELLKSTLDALVSIKHEPEVHVGPETPAAGDNSDNDENEPTQQEVGDGSEERHDDDGMDNFHHNDDNNDSEHENDNANANPDKNEKENVADVAETDEQIKVKQEMDDLNEENANKIAAGGGLKLKIRKEHGQLNSSIIEQQKSTEKRAEKRKKKKKHKDKEKDKQKHQQDEQMPQDSNANNDGEENASAADANETIRIKTEPHDMGGDTDMSIAPTTRPQPEATIMTSIPMMQFQIACVSSGVDFNATTAIAAPEATPQPATQTLSNHTAEPEDVKPNRAELDLMLKISHVTSGVEMETDQSEKDSNEGHRMDHDGGNEEDDHDDDDDNVSDDHENYDSDHHEDNESNDDNEEAEEKYQKTKTEKPTSREKDVYNLESVAKKIKKRTLKPKPALKPKLKSPPPPVPVTKSRNKACKSTAKPPSMPILQISTIQCGVALPPATDSIQNEFTPMFIKPEPQNRGYADEQPPPISPPQEQEEEDEDEDDNASESLGLSGSVNREEQDYISSIDFNNVVVKQEKDIEISDVQISSKTPSSSYKDLNGIKRKRKQKLQQPVNKDETLEDEIIEKEKEDNVVNDQKDKDQENEVESESDEEAEEEEEQEEEEEEDEEEVEEEEEEEEEEEREYRELEYPPELIEKDPEISDEISEENENEAREPEHDLEETKDDLKEDLKENKDDLKETEDLEEIEDDLKETEDDLKESEDDFKETEGDLKETEDDLKESEDDLNENEYLEETEHIEETEDDLKVAEDDLAEIEDDLKETEDDLKDTKDNHKEIEYLEETKDDLKQPEDDLKETEDDIEETEGDLKETEEDINATEDVLNENEETTRENEDTVLENEDTVLENEEIQKTHDKDQCLDNDNTPQIESLPPQPSFVISSVCSQAIALTLFPNDKPEIPLEDDTSLSAEKQNKIYNSDDANLTQTPSETNNDGTNLTQTTIDNADANSAQVITQLNKDPNLAQTLTQTSTDSSTNDKDNSNLPQTTTAISETSLAKTLTPHDGSNLEQPVSHLNNALELNQTSIESNIENPTSTQPTNKSLDNENYISNIPNIGDPHLVETLAASKSCTDQLRETDKDILPTQEVPEISTTQQDQHQILQDPNKKDLLQAAEQEHQEHQNLSQLPTDIQDTRQDPQVTIGLQSQEGQNYGQELKPVEEELKTVEQEAQEYQYHGQNQDSIQQYEESQNLEYGPQQSEISGQEPQTSQDLQQQPVFHIASVKSGSDDLNINPRNEDKSSSNKEDKDSEETQQNAAIIEGVLEQTKDLQLEAQPFIETPHNTIQNPNNYEDNEEEYEGDEEMEDGEDEEEEEETQLITEDAALNEDAALDTNLEEQQNHQNQEVLTHIRPAALALHPYLEDISSSSNSFLSNTLSQTPPPTAASNTSSSINVQQQSSNNEETENILNESNVIAAAAIQQPHLPQQFPPRMPTFNFDNINEIAENNNNANIEREQLQDEQQH